MKTPIELEPDKEIGIALTNFRGGHYEIHEIYTTHKRLSCKIKYHSINEAFNLEKVYSFKRPWILRWPESATLYLKNEANSKLVIQPTEIYFAGYLLKPTKVLKAVAPLNARNNFLIEGIRLR
jgi:hypothetical protein